MIQAAKTNSAFGISPGAIDPASVVVKLDHHNDQNRPVLAKESRGRYGTNNGR